MTDARDFHANEVLRNGTPVVIRAARPDDRERIAQAFGKLERESVYTRFFSYKPALSDPELGQIDSMDFVRDVMLVVTTIVDASEHVIASSRYVAHEEPDGSLSAEVAFTVEEDYQGNGIAGRLLAHLAALARMNGITRFVAEVLPQNKAMLAVFRKSGLPNSESREGGVVHLTLALSGSS
ncbi:MAG TPA: GNAT family protein [Casimicrobiaceae bacterium]|nr:GNAT family protein [Casimicrobiaceae bacterium]